jgi:hypothetical protein
MSMVQHNPFCTLLTGEGGDEKVPQRARGAGPLPGRVQAHTGVFLRILWNCCRVRIAGHFLCYGVTPNGVGKAAGIVVSYANCCTLVGSGTCWSL